MTDPVKEQLSACLDGELPEAELDLLVKQVHRDARLQQSVTRYALIGEVLRTGTSPVASAGFAARISQAIAAESNDPSQQHSAPAVARRTAPRWLRPVGGAAIAAGVAAVAVMALQPQLASRQEATIVEAAPDKAPGYVVPPSTPNAQIVPAAYLAKYVMAHSEYAGPLGRRAVLSSVLADDESELSETVDISSPPDADDTLPQPDPSIQPQR